MKKTNPQFRAVSVHLISLGLLLVLQNGFAQDSLKSETTSTSHEVSPHVMTGAVTVIDSSVLNHWSENSLDDLLRGTVPGVIVTPNSGAPGKSNTIRIRGISSFDSPAPLLIVDGNEVSSFAYLSPSDVEHITILRDGSSAAMYGIRGGNGVILVTTKRGALGKPRVNYALSLGWNNPWKNPNLMTAAQWASARNQAEINSGIDPDSVTFKNPAALGEGTNWWNEITHKNAFEQSHAVSVSGALPKFSYYLSGNFAGETGIIQGNEWRRTGVRSNIDTKIGKFFEAGYSLGVSATKLHTFDAVDEQKSLIMNALTIDPVTSVRTGNGTLNSAAYSQVLNPVGIIERNDNTISGTDFEGSAYWDISLHGKWKNHTSVGIEYQDQSHSNWIPAYFIGETDQTLNASSLEKSNIYLHRSLENSLSFQSDFGKRSSILCLAGYQMTSASTEFDSSITYESNLSGNGEFAKSDRRTSQSFLGRVCYGVANRYFLNGSIRGDGDSRFPDENYWSGYPSIGAAWVISEEPFMSAVKPVSLLKLRGGVGTTGHFYGGRVLPIVSTPLFGDNVLSGSTTQIQNRDSLHAEKRVSKNLGIDFGLFEKRLSISADLFTQKSDEIIQYVPVVIPTQTQYLLANGGSIENHGFESLILYNQKIKNVHFSLNGMVSSYHNEITSTGTDNIPIIDGGAFAMGAITRSEVGHSVGDFYGLVTDGLFQNQQEIDAYTYTDEEGNRNLIQPDAKPGDIRYKADSEGNLISDFIGSPHPDFTYGFGMSGAGKIVDCAVQFYGSQGNDLFNATRFILDNGSVNNQLDSRMTNAWNGENSTNDARTPRLSMSDPNGNTRISDRYIEDGSFLRLTSIELGVTIPSSVTKRIHIERLRMFCGAKNLVTFTKYSGLDPEIGYSNGLDFGESVSDQVDNPYLSYGIDRGVYPQPRTFAFGINCSL